MKLVLMTMIALITRGAIAQGTEHERQQRFMLVAGIGFSNMNFNKGFPKPDMPVRAVWKSGITAGIQVCLPLVEKLYLQSAYAYCRRNGADHATATAYTLDYVILPVLLDYQVTRRFSVLAGPQAELLIKAKAYRNGQYTYITHDVEERGVGLTAGIDVHACKRLALCTRYFYGLNRIGIGQRSSVKEFKYEAISISAGFAF